MAATRITGWICCIALFVSACGQGGLDGAYQDEMGMTRYEFQRNGRVYMTVLETTVAAEYQLDGRRVLITGPQGTLVLKREDGRLYGPMGLELTRVD